MLKLASIVVEVGGKMFVANLLVRLAFEISCPIYLRRISWSNWPWRFCARSKSTTSVLGCPLLSPWPAVAALGLYNVARIRLVVGRRLGSHWLKRRGGGGWGRRGKPRPWEIVSLTRRLFRLSGLFVVLVPCPVPLSVSESASAFEVLGKLLFQKCWDQ